MPRQCTQIKARIFEVPGAGGFLLTEWADGIDHYYVPGHEIATFRGLKELLEKIEYYLRHPQERDAIDLAGYKRTVTDHTYDQRLAEVLDFAVSARNQYVGRSGLLTTGRIDWSRFEIAASHHIMDWKLALLKRALVAACKIIWGSTRGPGAARTLDLGTKLASWRGPHLFGFRMAKSNVLRGKLTLAVKKLAEAMVVLINSK